jgi:hypothetical protein
MTGYEEHLRYGQRLKALAYIARKERDRQNKRDRFNFIAGAVLLLAITIVLAWMVL